MTRRRFAFWLGFGLFTLSEKLRLGSLDALAAATMRGTETPRSPSAAPEHWTAAENKTWMWFERENFLDGRWKLTGVTTPMHKKTGALLEGKRGYLSESVVPLHVRMGEDQIKAVATPEQLAEFGEHPATESRRTRHGRPPSKWLRSLEAAEIRIWLTTIEVPEAGVSGMTYWQHLTRDHSFDPLKIKGLTDSELARLHAAAHYGY